MTQREEIIEYIREYGSITPMQAFYDLGITKLATRVSEMCKDGIAFKIETVKHKGLRGKTVRYAKYTLLEDDNGGE